MKRYAFGIIPVFVLALALHHCGQEPAKPVPSVQSQKTMPAKRSYILAFSPKMLDNPVFNRAKIAAEKAAQQLSEQYGEISIQWSAPTEGDAAKQVEIIQGFIQRGVDGIAISCNDPDALKPAIDQAMDAGISTITFDSDSPDSNRITYFGTNDAECGAMIAEHLHQAMGGKGTYAIMTGVPGAYNLETRIRALKETLQAMGSGLELLQTVYCDDDIAKSVQQIEQVMRAHPDLGGWAMVGGWPLMTDNALPIINPPGSCKIVAVDALPQMWQYIEQGYVDTLLAQRVYHWGWESVHILMDSIVNHKEFPKNVWSGMDVLNKDNLEAYKLKWREWFREEAQ